jgi:hypothetical protein
MFEMMHEKGRVLYLEALSTRLYLSHLKTKFLNLLICQDLDLSYYPFKGI